MDAEENHEGGEIGGFQKFSGCPTVARNEWL
jgi:hypothetical protein